MRESMSFNFGRTRKNWRRCTLERLDLLLDVLGLLADLHELSLVVGLIDLALLRIHVYWRDVSIVGLHLSNLFLVTLALDAVHV